MGTHGGGWVAVLATVDTKAQEADFLRRWLREHGCEARVVDLGLRPPPAGAPPADLSREAVAQAADTSPEEVARMRRDQALATMGRGAGRLLLDAWRRGELRGALAIGGNQGTAAACIALRGLPLGVPKLVVSTVASGNLRPYIQASDVAVMFSVADFVGGRKRVNRGQIPSLTVRAFHDLGHRRVQLDGDGAQGDVADPLRVPHPVRLRVHSLPVTARPRGGPALARGDRGGQGVLPVRCGDGVPRRSPHVA